MPLSSSILAIYLLASVLYIHMHFHVFHCLPLIQHYSVEVEDAQQEEDNTRGESTNTDSDPDSFRFYSPESEPFIPPDVQNRAKEVLEELILDQKNGSSITDSCCGQCCDVIQPRRFPGDNLIPPFTPLLQRASNQGLKLMALFVNPSLPRAFRDGWVLIELAVTIYQFVLSCVSLAENHTEAFNIVYVTLASIALLLSLVDVLVHCVQLGSLASLYLYIRSKFNTRYQPARQSGPESVQSCCLLGEERRQRINKSLDLIRNIVSELVLYPLLICDMFDFIATGSYGRADSGEKINFSLFIVGAFYLVLSVYLARMLMIAFSLFSLRRIPRSSSHTQQTYVNLMIKFGIHVLGQLILSIVLIAAIGVKIRQENPNSCSNGNCVTASGYLIYAIIAGGLLPLLGIFSFFATNVYKIRIMSVSLWVDMVSLLQSESFTSVVFAKEGIHKAKEAAQNFAQKVQLVEVRKQLKGVINSMPSWAKRLYPLRFPAFWAFGIFYTLLLASFLVTLFLSEPEENFSTDFFEENLGLVAIVAGILLAMANIHILFLTGVLVSFMVVLVLLFLLSPVLFVVGVVFYLPLGCLFGCLEYFRSLAGEMSVFSKPAEHKSRIRSAIQQTRAELRK